MSHSFPPPPKRTPWWRFKTLRALSTDRGHYRKAIANYDRARAARGLPPIKHPGWIRRHKIVSSVVALPLAFVVLVIGLAIGGVGSSTNVVADPAPALTTSAPPPVDSVAPPPPTPTAVDTAAAEQARKEAEAKAKAEAAQRKAAAEKAAAAKKAAAEAKAKAAAAAKKKAAAKKEAAAKAAAKKKAAAKAAAKKRAAAAKRKAQQEAEARARANAPVRGVHPGAFCSDYDRPGVTSSGTAMRCTTTSSDDRYRWRRA